MTRPAAADAASGTRRRAAEAAEARRSREARPPGWASRRTTASGPRSIRGCSSSIRGAPHHHRVRQQPRACASGSRSGSTSSRASRWCARTTAASPTRSAARSRRCSSAGTIRGIVATSSLELGIDMGAVDLVVLVESPGAVARGLQRIGRAGHGVGAAQHGRLFPKHRGDLLEAAVVAERMREGAIEPLRCRATRSTCSPSRSSRWSRDRDRARSHGARRTIVAARGQLRDAARGRRCSACSTCSRAGTRRTRSPTCARASCGIAPPTCSTRAARRRAWSRCSTAARSPIAGSTPVHLGERRPAGRRARRGDGARVGARARSSCSARPPGASSRSPAIA